MEGLDEAPSIQGPFELVQALCTRVKAYPYGDTLIFVPPLSPNKLAVLLILVSSSDSLALLRAKRFSCCSSSHSLGDNLYRNSL